MEVARVEPTGQSGIRRDMNFAARTAFVFLACCAEARKPTTDAAIAQSSVVTTAPTVSAVSPVASVDAAQSPIASASVAPPPRAINILTMLSELRVLLQRNDLAVADVVRSVGSITSDPGIPMPMELRPAAPIVEKASLARFADGSVYVLDIVPRANARPTIAELRRLFGVEDTIPALHGEREVIFYPTSLTHWKVAVIALVSRCFDFHSTEEPTEPCVEISDTARVQKITFRRDHIG